MEKITLIIATSVLIEALVEYAKKIKDNPILIATIFLGILISFIFRTTLFNFLGASIDVNADLIITGILASRGSNFISDFIGRYTGKNITKIEKTEIIEDNTTQH